MKTTNEKLIQLLGTLKVLDTEEITEKNPKQQDDITYTTTAWEEKEYRIITDNIEDDELSLLIKAEQLQTLRNIDKTLNFFKILIIIGIVVSIIGLSFS